MKNPIKNKPLHLPGQSLGENLDKFLYDKILSPSILIIFSIIWVINEWIRWYWDIPVRPIATTVFGILIIIFCLYLIKKNLSKARHKKQGYEGEVIVGQSLEELRADGCLIFHDVVGKGFNIDHVVLSTKGIFTIETKTWSKQSGKEEVRFDGNHLIVNGYLPEKDPVIQLFAEASSLKKILKESTGRDFKVQPVIVFPGWFVNPDSSNLAHKKGFWLLNPKALGKYIQNEPETLSKEDLNLISYHLKIYLQNQS